MRYEFARLDHIDQVREAIKDRKEFIEADRDLYSVFNYLVCLQDTFPVVSDERTAILRECRGLIFDKTTGKVISRPFVKFFNLNERAETFFAEIDWSENHVILEKLDGSMIRPFRASDNILRWGTKMGETEIAAFVQEFVNTNQNYAAFASEMISAGRSPIFEFCSRKNKIVIDHPEDRLVLLAIRDNVTGEYTRYEGLKDHAEQHGIELVQQYAGTVQNMEKFIEEARDQNGIEGYVIRFDSGHMLKVKCDEYVLLHRTVSKLQNEKDVWRLVLEEKTDDLKALLPDDLRSKLDAFHSALTSRVLELANDLQTEFEKIMGLVDSKDYSMFENPEKEKKKVFAVEGVNQTGIDSRVRNLLFSLYNGEEALKTLEDYLIGFTSSGTKLETIRSLFGGLVWNPAIVNGEEG